MTFDEILAQIIDLLKRQGQVSYRALKRRFDIEDDYIEDLKEEILYVHPVIDDEGRGLIWTGDTAIAHEVAAPSAQTSQSPTAEKSHLPGCTSTNLASYTGSRTPPTHRHVLRPGRFYQVVIAARPRRLPARGT